MKSIQIAFDQSVKRGLSNYSSNVRLVNCYCASDPGGRTENALIPVPGSSLVASVSPAYGTGCRGAFRSASGPDIDGGLSTAYFVFGNSVFRYTRRGTVVLVGTFNSSNVSGSCTFVENQAQTSSDAYIYVCDRQSIYKFLSKADDASVSASWREVPNIPSRPDGDGQITPAYIAWSDYRLIVSAKDSNAWFYTETGTDTFKETNVYFGESSADKTIRVIEHGGSLWSFGAYSYDIFTRTGNRQNPYSNPKSASGRIGLASAESIACVDDYIFWLGSGDSASNGVYMADRAGTITRISDFGIENVLKDWKYQPYAYGCAFVERGQIFYALTSESDSMTVCYNLKTGRWHQASSAAYGKEKHWNFSYPVAGYGPGSVLFGSRASNSIAALDQNMMSEFDGKAITRVWQSPVYSDALRKFRALRCLVDVEAGTSSSYSDPSKFWFQASGDGGRTWRDRVDRSLGKKGAYGSIPIVFGCGMSNNLVMRIGTSDPSPLIMHGIRLDIEEAAR